MDRLWQAWLQAFALKDADIFFVSLISKPLFWGIILSVIYFVCLLVYNGKYTRKDILYLSLNTIGFSIPLIMLGFVAGHLTGISRSPVVGTVVPAVLTFIGALNVYAIAVVGNGKAAQNKIAIGYSVFLFASVFFYGVQTGAYQREYGNERRIIELSRQELRIRTERKVLGLPDNPPSWLWSLE